MPISFKKKTVKKSAAKAAPVAVETETEIDDDIPFDTDDATEVDVPTESASEEQVATETEDAASEETSGKSPDKWAYRGGAAKKAYDRAQEEANIPYRFRMKVGETRKITFLDGQLDQTGFFAGESIFEHTMNVGGQYPTYACTENMPDPKDNEPCPCCAQSGRAPYLVGFFTVIDHTGYKTNQGKTVKNVTRVYAAKRRTMSTLLHVAAKRGGLAGCRFDVTRVEGHANTGETFDFIKKFKVEDLCNKYNTKPIDSAIATNYKSRDELLKLGFGGTPIGAESSGGGGTVEGEEINVDEAL